MTKQLLKRLSEDFKSLEYELKKVLPKEIHKAASLGDLSENAEYEAALDRQRLLQSKLRKLNGRISEISQIDLDRLPKDRIGYGSKIQLLNLDDDSEIDYQLVAPEDADIERKRISISSPIGKALMGHREGDEVTIQIPSGVKNYEIIEVAPYCETDQTL